MGHSVVRDAMNERCLHGCWFINYTETDGACKICPTKRSRGIRSMEECDQITEATRSSKFERHCWASRCPVSYTDRVA